jgi:hypothetical protein
MAQIIGRIHYPAYDPPPGLVPPPNDPVAQQRVVIERAIDDANKLLFNWQEILRFASTLRVSYDSEDEKVQAEIAGVVNLVGHDFAVRSMLGYRFIDALLVQAGYEVFAGPKWRPFGSIRHLSGAFLQATYTF